MSEQAAATTEKKDDERGLRKERVGKVVSTKMQKTVVVEVIRLFAHPLYGKYVRRTKRYYAHDEKARCNVGDTVRIQETRPISKLKRWRISAVLERAK